MLVMKRALPYPIVGCSVSQDGKSRYPHVRRMVQPFASILKATSGNQASGTPCSKTSSVRTKSDTFGIISVL